MNHRSTVKRVICSIALMATCVMAAPGDLDTSFGPNGILVKDLGGDEQVRGVTLLPDGKMLLAGFSNKQGTYDMTLTRLLADGQPDKAFGTEGMVYTAIGAGDDQARTMIQQVDGRILVGGYSHNGTNYDFALVRYNLDGSLDVTFNATGKVTTAISTGDDFVRSLALQPDGKIVAAGYSVAAGTGTSENVTMARYLPDGALDSSFGVAGKVIISLSTDADFGRSVAVLADGNILVAGEMRPSGGGSTNFFVARLTPGGALDSSFGSGGAVTTDVAGANDTVLTMKLQADGKMVVAGFASTAGNNNFALVRYNPNGTLDTSFNGTGIVSTDINGGGDDQAFGLMIQGDGKLVAAGHANSNMVCVVRYTTGGVLDTTFSIDGKHAFQTGTFSRGHAVAQQADGAVVVVGTSQNGGPGDFLVARLQANGTPDPVFGGAGKVTTAVNSGGEVIYDLALAADGKIVAVGHGQNGATRDFTVARYLQNGVLDVTFGGNGKVQTPIGSGDDDAEAVAIQSDGKIVVAGHTITAARGWDIAVARYNTNGSLDTTFGSGGKMTPSSLGSDARDEYARRVVIDSTGRIFVLYEGIPHLGGTTHFKMQLLCLTNTGAADPSFGTGGWVSVDFGSGHNLPRAMTLQPDGRILVAGIADGNGGYDFALARLTTTGVLDSTFGGGDGKLTVDVGGRDDIARSVIVQSTGRIVVGGHASSGGGPYSFMQLGFDSSGNLDNTFDTDAVVLVPGGSGGALGFGMAVQPDNRIVMAGASISSSEDFGLFRVQANGALDSSFGTAGKVVTPIGGGNDRAYACIIQPDGKIIAAGHAWNGSNDDFALVRYMGNTPVVTTGAADNLGKFSARLNGAVTHNGIPTTARFEYGLTTAYGSSTASQSVGIMGGTVNVNASISGLVANTLYHYRLVAHNGVEDIYGPDATFTTLSDPPAAYTLTAADIGPASSTLIGIVVPGSFDATVTFEYGTTTAYGQTTAPQIFAAGNDFRSVTHGISGLSLGLTYHYRIVASSAGGTTYGLNGTFTTQASSTSPQSAPEVMTGVATNITIQSADVSRSVNPRYGTTFSWFEYGTTTAYGSATLQTSLGNGGAELQSQQTITGLLPGTLYHYRAMASNGLGTTAGLDMTFTTQFLPPVAVTSSAVPAGTTGFTLHGTVNASHALTAVSFEHSTDGTNWSSVPATPASVSGSSNVSVTASLANLSQFTTYFYRVKAQSAGGEVTGSILTLQPQIISGLAQQFPNAPPAANGSLNVTLTPAGILSGWRFTGEQSWRASGETAGGLVHGSRVIEFRPVPGYLQPGSEPVTVNSTGQTADFEYYATPVSGSGGMLVALKPDSIAQAVLVADRAQWRLLGETVWRDSGTSASSLSAGTYLVECKPLAGYSTPAVASITVSSGQTINPTLVYFTANNPNGLAPVVQSFSTVSTDTTMPYAYVGQIRSSAGLSSGFIVKPRVVATAAHVVWDDGSLSAARGLQWLFQRDAGTHDPVPLAPLGFYTFNGYAAQRIADNSPGQSSQQSQHLDVAAIYFNINAGRNGFSGWLGSDLSNNEFLLSNANKMLVGYPIDSIAPVNQGRMHATAPFNVLFTPGYDKPGAPHAGVRTFITDGLHSFGGNSGGPLCVQHTNGNWYPAAIYLGGTNQTVVRAIDSDVIEMFNRAETSANGGDNNNNGGISQTGYVAMGGVSTGSLIINITPSSAGWRPVGSTKGATLSGNTRSLLTDGEFYVEFSPVDGFQTPANQLVKVTAGATRIYAISYLSSQTPQESWRNTHFGTSANSGSAADAFDFDGDGFTNAQEYAAGTNPTLIGDFFKATNPQRSGNTFSVSTAGKTGRTYILERNMGLTGIWTVVISQGPLASDQAVTLTDAASPSGAAFYRIRVTGP